MENKVYTQEELRRDNIITNEYVLNLEPGEYIARLDLKAETPRRNKCLRLFFTFENGRRIMATTHWWQGYLGFYEHPVGALLRLTYTENARSEVYLTKAEVLNAAEEKQTALSYQATNCGDTIHVCQGLFPDTLPRKENA